MVRFLRETLEVVVLALLLFLGLQASVQNYRVEGSSMNPTLENGEYLLVNKLGYIHLDLARVEAVLPGVKDGRASTSYLLHPPQRGDVIVFHAPPDPSRDFVKRVIALPGETVVVRRGQVYVNGTLLPDSYQVAGSFDSTEPYTVPPDSYFVMGDNRNHSNDSRHWGPVPAENIVGRVWFTYWPREKFGFVP